jgi:hypothetical protein
MRPQFSARFEIESQSRAEAYRDDLAEKLGGLHPTTRKIVACETDDPCHLSICPLCTHRYREEVIPSLASLFEQPLECLSFVTMYVQVVSAGKLVEADVPALKESFRKVVARAEVSGDGLIVGALEPEWRADERKWLLHLHGIASDVDNRCWAQVRVVLRKRVERELADADSSGPVRRALRVDPVEDLLGQLSYCIKFVTYDRLPRAVDGRKGKPVSLKGGPLDELAMWRARYAPDDFLFLYGAKRLNGRFTRLARVD